MIEFHYETEFELGNETQISNWLKTIIKNEDCILNEINYIFCDDEYLHKLNVDYLDHDTLTDVISFDYCVGKNLQGDIFISIERVTDNAKDFNVSFEDELHRVICHGLFHFCGYKDKSDTEIVVMRGKENNALKLYKSINN
jgi:probable rRNA maturation factor